jgi:hypothetical protein
MGTKWGPHVRVFCQDECLDDKTRSVLRDLRMSLTPNYTPELQMPVSSPPSTKVRPTYAPLTPSERRVFPPLLAPFYSSFGTNTYFTCKTNSLIFYSRNEMMRRRRDLPDDCLDIAWHTNHAIGFTFVHTYLRSTGKMVTIVGDGNRGHRNLSAQRHREMMLQELLDGRTSNPDVTVHTDFAAWWCFFETN